MLRSCTNNTRIMVLLAAVVVMGWTCTVWGITLWRLQGFSDHSMTLILFGGAIIVFVLLGLAAALRTHQSSRPGSPQHQPSDLPPKYRDTWRLEYLQTCHTVGESNGAPSLADGCSSTDNASRVGVRTVCVPSGVYEATEARAASASSVTELLGHRNDRNPIILSATQILGSPGSPQGFYRNEAFCDDGLPSYQEALERTTRAANTPPAPSSCSV